MIPGLSAERLPYRILCDLSHNFAVRQGYGLFGANRGDASRRSNRMPSTRGYPSTLRHFHDSATIRPSGSAEPNNPEHGAKKVSIFATEFCNRAEGSAMAVAGPFESSILHQTFAACQNPLFTGLRPTMQNLAFVRNLCCLTAPSAFHSVMAPAASVGFATATLAVASTR